MIEHTPGPWKTGKTGGCIVSEHPEGSTTERPSNIMGDDDPYSLEYYGGYLICESVTEVNARLIAAAPDLLDACKEVDDWLDEHGGDPGEDPGLAHLLDKLTAAIVKATEEV